MGDIILLGDSRPFLKIYSWFNTLAFHIFNPSECVSRHGNKKGNPSAWGGLIGVFTVLARLRAHDMVNGALICDFLLQSVENNPFLFWIQMHQKGAESIINA